MFECVISGVTCRLSLLFPAVLLFLLVFDGDGVALFCFSAAFLHECAHGLALCLCRIKPRAITLSFFGMRIDLPSPYEMTPRQTVLVAAAGPLCNAVCAALLYGICACEYFLASHIVLCVLNSLPVMPLDGGRIVVTLCERVSSPETVARVENALFWVAWTSISVLGVVVCLYSGGNFTLLLVAIYVGALRLFCKCD